MTEIDNIISDIKILKDVERSQAGILLVKKFPLPEPYVHCIVDRLLNKNESITLKDVFNEKIG